MQTSLIIIVLRYKRGYMKTSKHTDLKNNNIYFTIYSYIQEGSNLKDISIKLNISKQSLNRYVRVLKANGLIEKIGYGTWKTSKHFHINTIPYKKVNSIRTHAFIWSLSLPKINNWDKREEFLKKNGLEYSTFKNRSMQKLLFRNYKIQLGNKKIVVYMPKWRSYFVNSAKTGYNYAIYDFQQLIQGLESLFNTSFKVNKGYKFKIGRQHHALIKNELARQFNRENKKLEVRDEKGYLWLLIDNSELNNIRLQELEAVDKEKSPIDMDNVVSPLMNTLRKEPNILDKMANMIMDVTKNQVIFDNNMKSHLEVLNKLGLAVDELRKELKNGSINKRKE